MEKHFTATVYIISKIKDQYKVLLHKHKKHKIWLGIGGHIEKDENPIETLLREVKEETNLKINLLQRRLLKTKGVEELVCPITILQEKLPPYRNEAAHFHIDLIYFAICKKPAKIKMKEAYGWFSEKDLEKLSLEKEVRYFSKKVLTDQKIRGILSKVKYFEK